MPLSNPEATLLRTIIANLENVLQQNGYELLDTPLIQPSELFLTRAGDQIADHLFIFERNGEQFALRPEFTSSALKVYLREFPETSALKRWLFSGYVFDDSAPLSNYQKYSVGAEVLGAVGIEYEAEIMALAAQALKQVGVTRWRLEIGHVALTRHLLSQFGLDARTQQLILSRVSDWHSHTDYRERLETLLVKLIGQDETISLPSQREDKIIDGGKLQSLQTIFSSANDLSESSGRTHREIIQRYAKKQQRALAREQYQTAIDFLVQWMQIQGSPSEAFQIIATFIADHDDAGKAILNEWENTIMSLKERGVSHDYIVIRPALTRNWEYYTGVVFEARSDREISLVGGGRYDDFARLMGANRDVPSIGLAFYVDQILAALA